MGRAYSQDLRERVIAAVEAGQSRNAVAKRFDLSVSCVVKWLQRYHREGSKKPRKIGGYQPLALAAHRVFVLGRMAEKPDLTISALAEELSARGIKVGRFAACRRVTEHGRSLRAMKTAISGANSATLRPMS